MKPSQPTPLPGVWASSPPTYTSTPFHTSLPSMHMLHNPHASYSLEASTRTHQLPPASATHLWLGLGEEAIAHAS